jgi:hypothetical protein
MVIYRGEGANFPGAAGNLLPGGPSFDINRTPGALIAAGIPVGQDPRFPMSQESCEQYVDERRLNKRLEPYGGSILEFLRQRNPANKGASLPGTPGNFGGLQNAQFYGGPQMGQLPPGYTKTIS